MEPPNDASSESQLEESAAGVRLIVLNLPEDEGEGLGFRLTRTLWDPYPWVRDVVPESRAESAGLRPGDCLLQADGKDLLGMPIGQVAGLIRGDGRGRGVSLLCWNCGVDPHDDPELLWSCGGGARGERARRALAGVVKALACVVCAATAAPALSCARAHLYCEQCWSRLDRCALCREALPPKDSPYARNLVAEQVFEAIATEYELKQSKRRPNHSSAARSPLPSPRGHYQLSMLQRRAEKFASDPNIRQSCSSERRVTEAIHPCKCSQDTQNTTATEPTIPTISVQQVGSETQPCSPCPPLPHKLVARVRHACSLADLHAAQLTQSLSNINLSEPRTGDKNHSSSMDNLKTNIGNSCESPVFVLTAPPIYVLACDHSKT